MNRKEEIIEQSLTLFKAGFRTTYSISQVLKRAKWLHLIHERQCNGYSKIDTDKEASYSHTWDAEAAAKDEAREERIKEQLRDLFSENTGEIIAITSEHRSDKPARLSIAFQGDPRGAPVIIHSNPMKDNGTSELGRIWG
jgi:hypothetical protein